MKAKIDLLIISVIIILGFTACDKSEETPDNSIEGTYVGTLTTEGLKSANGVIPGSTSATADVTKTNDGEIEVRCFSDELDTTFMLNYYENYDSIMVCLTSNAFEEMYGHMMGENHMGGGMMGDANNGETEWQHHLNDEHQSGDKHFGGFDTMNHTFGYQFEMMNGDTPYLLDFQGSKNQ